MGIRGMRYSEPRAEVDYCEPKRSPGRLRYDVWFFVDAIPESDRFVCAAMVFGARVA